MENKERNPIKILRMYVRVIEFFGIVISTIIWIISIALLAGENCGFIQFFVWVTSGVLVFLCFKVTAAFIEAYVNKCEDVHNIYMIIRQNEKNEISDNQ